MSNPRTACAAEDFIPENPEAQMLLSYWKGLNNGRSVPQKSQIVPRDLKQILPIMALFNVGEDGQPIFRLAGRDLVARRKSGDPTGKALSSFYTPDMHDMIGQIGQNVVEVPCGFSMYAKNLYTHGAWNSSYSMFLPLADDDGRIRYAIGLIAMVEEPFHYAIESDEHESIEIIDGGYLDLGFGLPANTA